MDINVSSDRQTSILALSGALDTLSAPSLSVRAIGLCDTGIRSILIDLAQVPHLTSAGFRSFIAIDRRAKQAGVAMALCGLNEMMHDLFEVSGLLRSFRIYPDRASAMAAIGEPGTA